ncbi:MAG: acyl-CoA dehydrogenase family protein [Thermodesulfobacteriota bacterium]|nr:acyl-CoA dehydrogenase family protein [Thermodesulfobacteriota bacterium]
MNAELKPFEDLAVQFAGKELSSKREENDAYSFGPFFGDVLEKAYEVGLLGITLPEELGGIGQGISALCVILDNICCVDASLGGIIFTTTVAQQIILESGSAKALESVTKNAANAGDFLIAFPAFNNPSEIPHVVYARKEKNRYILFGELEYVVLGGIAGHCLIPAQVRGERGYSFFLVNMSNKNIGRSEPVLSLGLHACPAVDMKLDDVEGILVGKEGDGSPSFERAADRMHVAAAAMSAGIMKGSFDEALAYTRERFQGGREIVNWSEVRMILSNMAVTINISGMALRQACRAVEENEAGWEQNALAAAIYIQGAACDLTTDGIQLLGGYGYMKDYGQEKRFRDAKHVQALLGMVPMKRLKYIKRLIDGGNG